jgi:hypothetical protein
MLGTGGTLGDAVMDAEFGIWLTVSLLFINFNRSLHCQPLDQN